MTSIDADKISTDEVIIDFISKKAIADQTEKLVLARISSKIEIDVVPLEKSINSLCERHLIRKVGWQGKISFELTPKGKTALEVLAKARADKLTKQLQEAIHQERKITLRSNIVKKMRSLAEKWEKYKIPDRTRMNEIELEANKLLLESKELQNIQPLCTKDPLNYDKEFLQYKPKIQNLIDKNNDINKSVNIYAKIKNYQELISVDIETISKTIKKYESLAEATNQISHLKTWLTQLKTIQAQLNSFGKDELSRFEELETKLVENVRRLEILKKPTHEFKPIKKGSVMEKSDQNIGPEGPINFEDKTDGYQLEEKCGVCGTKRKSTPVNIG